MSIKHYFYSSDMNKYKIYDSGRKSAAMMDIYHISKSFYCIKSIVLSHYVRKIILNRP